MLLADQYVSLPISHCAALHVIATVSLSVSLGFMDCSPIIHTRNLTRPATRALHWHCVSEGMTEGIISTDKEVSIISSILASLATFSLSTGLSGWSVIFGVKTSVERVGTRGVAKDQDSRINAFLVFARSERHEPTELGT